MLAARRLASGEGYQRLANLAKPAVIVILVVAALLVRPQGLFGRH